MAEVSVERKAEDMNTAEYAKENPLCELTGQRAEHVHHIWGGKQRLDLRSNLIRLSVSAHELCHTEIVQGRCLCMLAKLAKGEFDLFELDEAAGQSVVAWVDRHEDYCDASRRLHRAMVTCGLLNPEQRYKRGDRVKVARRSEFPPESVSFWHPSMDEMVGREFVVEEVDQDNSVVLEGWAFPLLSLTPATSPEFGK